LILSRQALPTLDRNLYSSAENLSHGAYVLADLGGKRPDLVLIASGSEVHLILEAAFKLVKDHISVRVVSFPSWDLFRSQEKSYQNSVLPDDETPRLAVEAGVTQGWDHWLGRNSAIIGIDHFGASAPANVLFEKFGFTINNIIKKAQELIK